MSSKFFHRTLSEPIPDKDAAAMKAISIHGDVEKVQQLKQQQSFYDDEDELMPTDEQRQQLLTMTEIGDEDGITTTDDPVYTQDGTNPIVGLYDKFEQTMTATVQEKLTVVSQYIDQMYEIHREMQEFGEDIVADIHKLTQKKYAAFSMIETFRAKLNEATNEANHTLASHKSITEDDQQNNPANLPVNHNNNTDKKCAQEDNQDKTQLPKAAKGAQQSSSSDKEIAIMHNTSTNKRGLLEQIGTSQMQPIKYSKRFP